MGAFKIITGKRVVKSCCVKPDHLKLPAMVIAVTRSTLLPAHVRRRMITFVLTNPVIQWFVAGKTFFIGDTLI